jgi:large subunit ribosomal protein L7/L12
MAAAMAQAALPATKLGAASSSILRTSETQTMGRVQLARFPIRNRSVAVRALVADPIVEELVEKVKKLTLEQARSFVKELEEQLGVTAASYAPSAPAAGGAAPEAAAAVEEKTEFDVYLDEVPASARIAVIKVVRTLTSLGLKEAKDMIEGLPKKVKEGIAKEESEEAVKALEAAGAKCSVK